KSLTSAAGAAPRLDERPVTRSRTSAARLGASDVSPEEALGFLQAPSFEADVQVPAFYRFADADPCHLQPPVREKGEFSTSASSTGFPNPYVAIDFNDRQGIWNAETSLSKALGEDPAKQCRAAPGDGSEAWAPAGLRNLGCTCYLNSLFQYLFFNLDFRHSLLRASSESKVVAALQQVFALLAEGEGLTVDTEAFVSAARVNALEQADATEFSALLLDWLQRELDAGGCAGGDFIPTLFEGEASQVLTCGEDPTHTSELRERFMELRARLSPVALNLEAAEAASSSTRRASAKKQPGKKVDTMEQEPMDAGISMPSLKSCWTMPVEELEEHFDGMMAAYMDMTIDDAEQEEFSEHPGPSEEPWDVPRAVGPMPAYNEVDHAGVPGCHRTMSFLTRVVEVLTDRVLRARYMEFGETLFKSPFANDRDINTTAPLVNVGFLKQLMKMQGAHEVTIGKFPFVEYLEAIIKNNVEQYAYKECALAQALGVRLRLTGKAPQYPILSLPRIVRNAAFKGTGLVELDLPASHGQQIYKYARQHGLPLDMLEAAFGNHDFLQELCMARLPNTLGKLKKQIAQERSHMVKHCPSKWKEALLQRERWELTLLSVHCQIGERRDLELCESNLPEDTPCRGYLGDSISVIPGPTFDSKEYCNRMALSGIYVTIKAFPTCDAEYFEVFENIKGFPFNKEHLHRDVLRHREAMTNAKARLEAPLVKGKRPPCLHLEFSIALKPYLLLARKPGKEKVLEYFCAKQGVWFGEGGDIQCMGENISDVLHDVFAKRQFGYSQEGDGHKVRLKKGERNLLWSSATFLNPIKALCKELKFDQDVAPLDQDEHLLKVVHFKGKNHMDFSFPPPKIDWESDKEIEQALNIPIQVTTPRLRTTRFVDKAFVEHTNPHRFKVARIINKVMMALDEDGVLSAALEKELTEVIKHEDMLQKVFYEVCTFMDDGDGSTGKGGTLGEEGKKPSELLSNLAYCKHAWVDDFKPSQPLSSNILRNLSGGNFIMAARKGKGGEVFKFHGQLLLACTGVWASDTPFVGADIRRIGGLGFVVRYTKEGDGKNERKKDGGIKSKISSNAYFSAWLYYVRVLWLAHHPFAKEDHCEPQCPNTLALRGKLMHSAGVTDRDVVPDELADTFIKDRLTKWNKSDPIKPSSSAEIDEAFAMFVCSQRIDCDVNTARQILRSKLVAKVFTVPAIKNIRNKSSQNSYAVTDEKVAYTLIPVRARSLDEIFG
ncbi:unnamed protein product, partial [Polarella glacialis]